MKLEPFKTHPTDRQIHPWYGSIDTPLCVCRHSHQSGLPSAELGADHVRKALVGTWFAPDDIDVGGDKTCVIIVFEHLEFHEDRLGVCFKFVGLQTHLDELGSKFVVVVVVVFRGCIQDQALSLVIVGFISQIIHV